MGTNIFRFESDLEILLVPIIIILLSSCFQSDTVIFLCMLSSAPFNYFWRFICKLRI